MRRFRVPCPVPSFVGPKLGAGLVPWDFFGQDGTRQIARTNGKTKKWRRVMAKTKSNAGMLEKPDFGHLQAIVCKTIDRLGSEAHGAGVIQALVRETSVWIDPSPIYTVIRNLHMNGYLTSPALRDSTGGGPPLKVYKLTEKGRAAIKATAKHYRAVADYLDEHA